MRSEPQAVRKGELETATPLARLGAALDALRVGTGNPKMHIQQARLLVHVAASGEVLQKELKTISGVAQSSVSRNLSLLSDGLLSEKKPGYGLLEVKKVPHNKRCNAVRLTEKGKVLAWDMQQAFAGIDSPSARPPSPSSPS